MAPSPDPHRSRIEVLEREDCETLLAQMPIGRVAFMFAGQPVVLPVNYRWIEGEILFRTFTGQKFHAAKARQHVAFEVDAWDLEQRSGWSVLVKGRAETVDEWLKQRAADELDLDTWADPDVAGPWVRIIADEVTGRRLA